MSAIPSLNDLCREIDELGGPANPSLTRLFKEAYRVLNMGGTIVGPYGSGKTLLSILFSLTRTAAGADTVVVNVSAVLRKGENADTLSVTLAGLDSGCIRTIVKWGLGTAGMRQTEIDPDRLVKRAEEVGKAVIDSLRDVHSVAEIPRRILTALKDRKGLIVVLDEFERIVQHLDFYGYRDKSHLIEDFFELVDLKRGIAIALPSSIYSFLDLQIKSRLYPTLTLAADPAEMKTFLLRLAKLNGMDRPCSGSKTNPVELVKYRNPRVVVGVVRELGEAGCDGYVVRRINTLVAAAMAYPRRLGEKSRTAIAVLYLAAWINQSAYVQIRYDDIRVSMDLVKTYRDAVNGGSEVAKIVEAMSVRDVVKRLSGLELVRRIGDAVSMSDEVRVHLLEFLNSDAAANVVNGADPAMLRLELSL